MSRQRDRNGFYLSPSQTGEKACSKCGETKSLTAFSWNKHYGQWRSCCIWCQNHSQNEACEECQDPVADISANRARAEGRPVLCQVHGAKARGARMRKPLVHGTLNAYAKRGCRCSKCRVVANADREKRRREVIAGIRPPVSHGTNGSYASGCRCDWCREGRNAYVRNLRRQKRRDAA